MATGADGIQCLSGWPFDVQLQAVAAAAASAAAVAEKEGPQWVEEENLLRLASSQVGGFMAGQACSASRVVRWRARGRGRGCRLLILLGAAWRHQQHACRGRCISCESLPRPMTPCLQDCPATPDAEAQLEALNQQLVGAFAAAARHEEEAQRLRGSLAEMEATCAQATQGAMEVCDCQ
jgi:hypothetical protein